MTASADLSLLPDVPRPSGGQVFNLAFILIRIQLKAVLHPLVPEMLPHYITRPSCTTTCHSTGSGNRLEPEVENVSQTSKSSRRDTL
jgi:hypothetical protein